MTDDLLVWLGGAADDMTPEQIERTRTEAARICTRYPDADHFDEYQAALGATVQHILGDVTPGMSSGHLAPLVPGSAKLSPRRCSSR